MGRPRCSYCQRPVERLWLRCPVCHTRLMLWYALAATFLLGTLTLLAILVFREA